MIVVYELYVTSHLWKAHYSALTAVGAVLWLAARRGGLNGLFRGLAGCDLTFSREVLVSSKKSNHVGAALKVKQG